MDINWLHFFLISNTSITLFSEYIDLRQRSLLKRTKKMPKELEDHMSQEEFEENNAY